jgi:hypothetical protein
MAYTAALDHSDYWAAYHDYAAENGGPHSPNAKRVNIANYYVSYFQATRSRGPDGLRRLVPPARLNRRELGEAAGCHRASPRSVRALSSGAAPGCNRKSQRAEARRPVDQGRRDAKVSSGQCTAPRPDRGNSKGHHLRSEAWAPYCRSQRGRVLPPR